MLPVAFENRAGPSAWLSAVMVSDRQTENVYYSCIFIDLQDSLRSMPQIRFRRAGGQKQPSELFPVRL